MEAQGERERGEVMRAFSIIDAEQRSSEWFQARLGRLTGSTAGKMLAKTKSGWAADRKNLLMQLCLERLTQKPQDSGNGYQSEAMKIGIEREPLAIAAYEAQTGFLFEQTGFLSHNSLMAGASLDAHLGDFEILVSIKCRQPAAHWDFLRAGIIDAKAIAQMRHEAWLCADTFQEHHYVSWNSDFPEGKQLKAVIYTPKMLDIPDYEGEALKFLDEVDEELKMIDGWNAVKAGVA
jgi:hypothetical protein